MATPTVIRSMTIKARGLAPDIHQVISYQEAGQLAAIHQASDNNLLFVYQVYSVEKGGETILQVSRPWGTERGAIADWERFTTQAIEEL